MATPENSRSLSDFESQLRKLFDEHEADFFGSDEPVEAPAKEAVQEYYTSEMMAEFFPEEDFTVSPAEDGSVPAETPDEAPAEDGFIPAETLSAEPAEGEVFPAVGGSSEEESPARLLSEPASYEAYDAYLEAEQAASAEPYDAYLSAEQNAEAPSPVRPRRPAGSRPTQAKKPASAANRPERKPQKKAPVPLDDEEDAAPRGEGLRRFFRGVGRTLAVILSTVLLFALAVIGAIVIVTRGPSEDARRLFVLSTNETSALKFVPGLFLPNATVESILHPEQEAAEAHVFAELPFEAAAGSSSESTEAELVQITEETATDELELIDIRENTFKGKMLIIHDPTRVKIASIKDFGVDFGNYGLFLTDFIERSGAIAGTNAGGFYDPNGQGNGGTPDGLVIREGALAFGSPYSLYTDVIGFDANHVLHVGDMSGQQALDVGIVEGISFAAGPVLIENGVKRTGLGGGVNPRTCIGQRSDGVVLIMVVEGRHPDSLGATYDDLADLMEEYGAVNAANLDGGSSSTMIYNGEQITKGSTIVGSRPICTALLVTP